MSPEQRQQRFTGNSDHIQIEGILTGIALSLGVNLDRAIALSGPDGRRHQRMLRHFKEVILVEIIDSVFRQMIGSLSGANKGWRKRAGAFTTNGYSHDQNQSIPRLTRAFNTDIFAVVDRHSSWGLLDYDGCQRGSDELVRKLINAVQNNEIDGRCALRATISTRGSGQDSALSFIRRIEAGLSSIGFKRVRMDCYPFKEGGKGCPMAMIQWVLERDHG